MVSTYLTTVDAECLHVHCVLNAGLRARTTGPRIRDFCSQDMHSHVGKADTDECHLVL